MDLLRYLYAFFFAAIFNSFTVVFYKYGRKIDILLLRYLIHQDCIRDESLELAKSCLIYIFTCKAKRYRVATGNGRRIGQFLKRRMECEEI